MALSDNIRKRRIELGLSQKQLADKIGVTDMAVSKFEANLASPKPERFVMLAKALDTTCEELVEGGVE